MATWDFKSRNVEFTAFDANKTITAESVLIAAGKPTLSQGTSAATAGAGASTSFEIYPIGLVENFGLTMGSNLQRIFEIGSQKSVIIPGRVIGTATIARIIYDHHTLLRVLYSLYAVQNGDNTADIDKIKDQNDVQVFSDGTMTSVISKRLPGYDEFWLNLDSDIFRYPVGLAIYFKNKAETTTGGIYLENCLIGGSQITINAGTDVLAEGVNLQFTEAVPIRIKDVNLA